MIWESRTSGRIVLKLIELGGLVAVSDSYSEFNAIPFDDSSEMHPYLDMKGSN